MNRTRADLGFRHGLGRTLDLAARIVPVAALVAIGANCCLGEAAPVCLDRGTPRW